MKKLNLTRTSPYWPYIRAIGKALTIPGTKVGPGILVDFQDKLSGDEAQRKHKESLEAIRDNLTEIAAVLNAAVSDVSDAAQAVAEALYLRRLADAYLYADFKGSSRWRSSSP